MRVVERLFLSFEEARQTVTLWIRWYNEGRPHQELGYLSPEQYRLQQAASVA
jgi:putative transposase